MGRRRPGFVAQFARDTRTYLFAGVELFAYCGELWLARTHALAFERHDGRQGVAHLQQFARRYAFACHLAHEAFEVADGSEVFEHVVAPVGVAEEMFYYVEALVDGLGVFERHLQPTAQQARTHGGDGAVNHAKEALAVGVEGFEELEVAHREAVEAHIFAGLDAAD